MKLIFRTSTIITILIVVALGGLGLVQRWKTDNRPPVVERKIETTTPSGIAPAPEFLLRHREELVLTASQAQQITELAAAYRIDIADAQRRLDKAAIKYGQYLEGTRKNARTGVGTLQAQGGEVQHLSSVIAATRHSYWERARGMLADEQRAQADALVRQAKITDLR
jgi:hypothetical protein